MRGHWNEIWSYQFKVVKKIDYIFFLIRFLSIARALSNDCEEALNKQ